MDTQTTAPPRATDKGAADRRRTARHELLELLVLRQRPVAAGVAGTVVVCLLLALVAPGLVPPTAVVGALVGILALSVGTGLAIVVDGKDEVLRGPWHARRDGASVLGWLASTDEADATPVVRVLTSRLETRRHLRLLLVDGGGRPAAAARSLGAAAAAAGATSLVVDLTDSSTQPGIAAVGDGSVKLASAASIADDRPFATIGVGRRQLESVVATRSLLRRPPSDLQLVIVVAPTEVDQRRALEEDVDGIVLVVGASARRRGAVRDELRTLGAAPSELLLVGGHLTDAGGAETDVVGHPRPTPTPTPSPSPSPTTSPAHGDTAQPLEAAPGPDAASPVTDVQAGSVPVPPAVDEARGSDDGVAGDPGTAGDGSEHRVAEDVTEHEAGAAAAAAPAGTDEPAAPAGPRVISVRPDAEGRDATPYDTSRTPPPAPPVASPAPIVLDPSPGDDTTAQPARDDGATDADGPTDAAPGPDRDTPMIGRERGAANSRAGAAVREAPVETVRTVDLRDVPTDDVADRSADVAHADDLDTADVAADAPAGRVAADARGDRAATRSPVDGADDLVTTATLEFLAADVDEER